MSKVILFQGDSITDSGRNREDIASTGVGYVHILLMVKRWRSSYTNGALDYQE